MGQTRRSITSPKMGSRWTCLSGVSKSRRSCCISRSRRRRHHHPTHVFRTMLSCLHSDHAHRTIYIRPASFIACTIKSPICAGLSAILAPAFSSALTLSLAAPLPPLMIAPACPIRRPGGAVRPAMNATTGFGFADVLLCCSRYSAASSSIDPPISPMRTIPSVRGSERRTFTTSMCCVPGKGSPPIPTVRD